MYFIWQFLNLEKLIVSKDVGFHETNLYYSKNLEVATQGENCLDLFPLPTIEIMSNEVQPNSFQVPASEDLPSSEDKMQIVQPIVSLAKRVTLHEL